ncbi:hypothetical protein HELRODRAFT_171918 [Helobdella robusta]|uniref:Apple domain-containing protein n=1 Tax=Helobdella robusta TaxID=6412 RepID=T1F4U7_HELRO|nr:hypothetical protein HELRODRAFT_171918 [Helobdella robusta]ESO04916.1 hypothetical protein HELRODRAFT_171918 [Helobdella robusta]
MFAVAFISLNLWLLSIGAKKCFQRFEEDNASFCSCDPAIEDRSLSTFSFLEALMLCSMRCSQTASCVAYNFFNATNQCQLFNQTLNKFSVLPGCQYFFKKEEQIKPMMINTDDELKEFYFNGENVPVAMNFPHANDWDIPDWLDLSGSMFVLAVKAYNRVLNGWHGYVPCL